MPILQIDVKKERHFNGLGKYKAIAEQTRYKQE